MTRGGAQTPGPGKKQGRPKTNRGKCNFFIRKDLIAWLVQHKPQHKHIEKALDEYIKKFNQLKQKPGHHTG